MMQLFPLGNLLLAATCLALSPLFAEAKCKGNRSLTSCCCPPDCPPNGSGCPQRLIPPGCGLPTSVSLNGTDGIARGCGANFTEANCLLFVLDLLVFLQGPVKSTLKHEYIEGEPTYGYEDVKVKEDVEIIIDDNHSRPSGTPACGPGQSLRSCLTYLLGQIESIPNPVNITLNGGRDFQPCNSTVEDARKTEL